MFKKAVSLTVLVTLLGVIVAGIAPVRAQFDLLENPTAPESPEYWETIFDSGFETNEERNLFPIGQQYIYYDPEQARSGNWLAKLGPENSRMESVEIDTGGSYDFESILVSFCYTVEPSGQAADKAEVVLKIVGEEDRVLFSRSGTSPSAEWACASTSSTSLLDSKFTFVLSVSNEDGLPGVRLLIDDIEIEGKMPTFIEKMSQSNLQGVQWFRFGCNASAGSINILNRDIQDDVVLHTIPITPTLQSELGIVMLPSEWLEPQYRLEIECSDGSWASTDYFEIVGFPESLDESLPQILVTQEPGTINWFQTSWDPNNLSNIPVCLGNSLYCSWLISEGTSVPVLVNSEDIEVVPIEIFRSPFSEFSLTSHVEDLPNKINIPMVARNSGAIFSPWNPYAYILWMSRTDYEAIANMELRSMQKIVEFQYELGDGDSLPSEGALSGYDLVADYQLSGLVAAGALNFSDAWEFKELLNEMLKAFGRFAIPLPKGIDCYFIGGGAVMGSQPLPTNDQGIVLQVRVVGTEIYVGFLFVKNDVNRGYRWIKLMPEEPLWALALDAVNKLITDYPTWKAPPIHLTSSQTWLILTGIATVLAALEPTPLGEAAIMYFGKMALQPNSAGISVQSNLVHRTSQGVNVYDENGTLLKATQVTAGNQDNLLVIQARAEDEPSK